MPFEEEDTNDRGVYIQFEDMPNKDREVEEPKIGKVFNSDGEAYNYYKKCGKDKGFGVIRKSRKFDENKKLKYVTFSCPKAGAMKCVSIARPRPSIKTKCNAKINLVVGGDGCYTIKSVNLEHNHTLSPLKAHFFICNKELNLHAKKSFELNDQAGVSLTKTFNSFVVKARGYESLTFGERECRNYIAKARQFRLGIGDAEALHGYFVRMKKKNSIFFYKIEFDDENRIKNVFWADVRSITAYESFGDVATFDTTNLTNKYDMSFALFFGVNHHGQSILLGYGLLSNEDTRTYAWLFEARLECMKGISPKGIITDQCKAIKGGVNEVFPNARHRLCLWHIMKKIPKKLSKFRDYEDISDVMVEIVYESITQSDFEERWGKMIKD